MKLKKLLRELDKFDDVEAEVLLASDEEGNSFEGVRKVVYQELDNSAKMYIVVWPTQH